ncbi:MAG: hypothetical protein AAGE76_06140 [Pseudomonadota bacterium]
MIPLNDPVWRKLYTAHGYEDVPAMLAQMRDEFDEDTKDFLYDSLVHQETCYPATYAAVPHLLDIARTQTEARPADVIASALAWVIVCSVEDHTDDPPFPQGLPRTPKDWARAVDWFDRSGSASTRAGMDMEAILRIGSDWYASVPQIGQLCTDRLKSGRKTDEMAAGLLMGVIAADGDADRARVLENQGDGWVGCMYCGATHHFLDFEDRRAIYPDTASGMEAVAIPTSARLQQPDMLDFKAGAPDRASTFATPAGPDAEAGAGRAIAVAEQTQSPRMAASIRNLFGHCKCLGCGRQTLLTQRRLGDS